MLLLGMSASGAATPTREGMLLLDPAVVALNGLLALMMGEVKVGMNAVRSLLSRFMRFFD